VRGRKRGPRFNRVMLMNASEHLLRCKGLGHFERSNCVLL
jgi:hypothetical protein